MNKVERQIERDKKLSEILEKLNIIMIHLGITEDEDDK